MEGILASGNLVVIIAIGLVAMAILVLSSDEAVRRFLSVAAYCKLSGTFMGMTVLSLATTLPEISAHLTGSVGILTRRLDYKIGSAIVLGSNIGSDVVQQTLIMALVGFVAGGLYFRRYFLAKCMIPMIGTTIQCLILGWDRDYSRLDGAILFSTFLLYMWYLYWDERKHYKKTEAQEKAEAEGLCRVPADSAEATRDAILGTLLIVIAIASTSILLSITQRVVTITGLGGSFIGVITLGVAAATPELAAAVAGLRHGDTGISLGTLVGSNITNPCVGIGLGALASTYWVPRGLIFWDLPWEAVTGAILWVILWFNHGRLGKNSMYGLVALYFVYIGLRAMWFLVD